MVAFLLDIMTSFMRELAHCTYQVLLPKNCIWILAESDTKQQVAAVSPNAIFFLFTVKCGVDFHLYKFMISGMLQQFFRFLTFQILPKRRRRDMPQSRRKLEQKRQLGALVFNYYWRKKLWNSTGNEFEHFSWFLSWLDYSLKRVVLSCYSSASPKNKLCSMKNYAR